MAFKKFDKRQLTYLAESLTDEQMAYLIESEPAQPQPSQNQAPQQSAQPQATNEPADQKIENRKADPNKVKSVCNAIKKGALNNIDVQQLKKFVMSAKIGLQDIAQAIKFAVDSINGKIQGAGGQVDPASKNIIKGVSNCMMLLQESKSELGSSINEQATTSGIDMPRLSHYVREKKASRMYAAGFRAINESYVASIDKMVSITESLSDSNISERDKASVKAIFESLENAKAAHDIEKNIGDYYALGKMIKKINGILEAAHVEIPGLRSYTKLTSEKDKRVNESISALKYSIAWYKANKNDVLDERLAAISMK